MSIDPSLAGAENRSAEKETTLTPIERHNAEVAWVKERIFETERARIGCEPHFVQYKLCQSTIDSLQANLKVLERHAPDEKGNCKCCIDFKIHDIQDTEILVIPFPCPTRLDITEGWIEV